jgi:hypothetical protein
MFVPLLQSTFGFSKDNNPAYQNSVEFCAIIIGLFKLVQLGYKDIGVHLEGVSMSALCWSAFKIVSKKGPSFLTACAQMMLTLRCNIIVFVSECSGQSRGELRLRLVIEK